MAIIDVFPFFNEVDLLEIRLNELDSIVDYFVITEATTTFSGEPKRLIFQENSEKFSKFKDKIIHQVVDNIPNLSPFQCEWYQRDRAKNILENLCTSSDYIIYGDVDEMPRISEIEKCLNGQNGEAQMYHFAQDLFYFYINVKETSGKLRSHAGDYPFRLNKKWLGSNLSRWEYASKFSMTELREPSHKKFGRRIANGGWHFSYIGSEHQAPVIQRVKEKISSYAHQELNTVDILENLENNIDSLEDIFNRRGARFEVMSNLEYLPDFISKNITTYDYLMRK